MKKTKRPVKKGHQATYQEGKFATVGTSGIMSQSTGVLGPLVGNGLLFPMVADVGWLLPLDFICGRLYVKMILQGCHCQRSALCGLSVV